MKKKIFKSKKWLIGMGCLTAIVAIPTILTSCSSIDKSLINKTFSKGDGDFFANDYSISTVAEQALKSDAGAKAMANSVANTMMLDWFQRLSSEPGQEVTKRLYDAQVKSVNDDYKNQFKSSSDSNGVNNDLIFQQQQLDPNGGTEESWKKNKMLEWAKSEFSSRLFEKDYLAVVNSDNSFVTLQPTLDQIIKSVKDEGYKFSFTEKAILNGNKNPYADAEYAKFQQFIYDQWVQVENPFVINMVLWKYGTPKEGINNLYNSEATKITDKASTGNYSFPYFSSQGSSNDNGGTVTKFINFVNQAKTNENYYSANPIEKDLGIRDIDTGFTDDSSTLIFAKNSSIYNDLYIEFAAASTHLLQKLHNTTAVTKATSTNNPLEKSISTTTDSNGFDAITSNFVSTTTSNNPSAVKLSSTLVTQLINKEGPLKNLSSDLYTIDAFVPNEDSKLTDFMFIRDEAGVHAVAIDGQKFIQGTSGNTNTATTTTAEQAKKNAAKIVLYHYFLGKTSENKKGLEIDIKNELSNFYNSNSDYLIAKYIETSKDQKIFNIKMFDLNLENLYKSYANYAMELSRIDKVNEYNDKMFSQKQTYALNYGVDTKKNGLASGWAFNKTSNIYDVANSVKFVLNNSNGGSNGNDIFGTNGSYSTYVSKIKPYLDVLNLKPLKSNFAGFKYSQYIYSDDYIVNTILLAYGNDSNSMGDSMKVDVLSKYLLNDFDLSTFKFKTSAFGGKNNTELDNALINNFYSSTFNSLTNKWTKYTETTFDKEKLNTYKFNLYTNTMKARTSATISNEVSLLTLVATAKYLLDNNGQEFLNYLKTKVTVGKDSYIAWTSTYNSELSTKPTSITKVSDLLNVSNIQQNTNNSYTSAYTGLKAVATTTPTTPTPATTTTPDNLVSVEKNNTDAFFSSDSTNYYSVVGDKLGFVGLIDSESSLTSNEIKNRLFTDPTIDNTNKKGVLFSYGTRDELVQLIDSYSYESEITELANDLMKKTRAFDAGNIFDAAANIQQKKQILKSIVQDTSKITDVMFQRRDNYIGATPTTSTANTTNNNADVIPIEDKTIGDNIKSGAFVYQINNSDLKDWTSFQNVFANSNNSTNKSTSSNLSTTNDIIYNLLFTAAADSNIQSNALLSILSDVKLTVYDSRLNTQLGPKWINNWKN